MVNNTSNFADETGVQKHLNNYLDYLLLSIPAILTLIGLLFSGMLLSLQEDGSIQGYLGDAMIVSFVITAILGLPLAYFSLKHPDQMTRIIYPPNIEEMSPLKFYLGSRFVIVPVFCTSFLFLIISSNIGFLSMNGI